MKGNQRFLQALKCHISTNVNLPIAPLATNGNISSSSLFGRSDRISTLDRDGAEGDASGRIGRGGVKFRVCALPSRRDFAAFANRRTGAGRRP